MLPHSLAEDIDGLAIAAEIPETQTARANFGGDPGRRGEHRRGLAGGQRDQPSHSGHRQRRNLHEITFDPNQEQPFGELGTVYPSVEFRNVCGVIRVTSGGLISSDYSRRMCRRLAALRDVRRAGVPGSRGSGSNTSTSAISPTVDDLLHHVVFKIREAIKAARNPVEVPALL